MERTLKLAILPERETRGKASLERAKQESDTESGRESESEREKRWMPFLQPPWTLDIGRGEEQFLL